MSHYTVLAIIRKGSGQSLGSLFAPYDENERVAPYVAKTKAQLIYEEAMSIAKYRRSHAAARRLSKDEYLAIADKGDLYGNYDRMRERLPYGYGSIDLTDEEALFERVKKKYGRDLNEDGDLISTYNPDSKWDWYAIGGRWDGQLRLKDGTPVNGASAGLVDWDAMFSRSPADAERDAAFWDEYVLGNVPEGVEDEGEYIYNRFGCIPYRREYYLESYGTREEYVRRMGLWSTYAVLDDEGWHEPGAMGWWGCSAATPESRKDWEDGFRSRFVDTLDPEDIVTVVDCHI